MTTKNTHPEKTEITESRNYAELVARVFVIDAHVNRINSAVQVLGGQSGAHQVAVMYLEDRRWKLMQERRETMAEIENSFAGAR